MESKGFLQRTYNKHAEIAASLNDKLSELLEAILPADSDVDVLKVPSQGLKCSFLMQRILGHKLICQASKVAARMIGRPLTTKP